MIAGLCDTQCRRGAAIVMQDLLTEKGNLEHTIEQMRTDGLDTVNVYGLEYVPDAWISLFRALKRNALQVVIRIEDYSDTFAFSEAEDIPHILNHYRKLLDFVCAPERRDCVAYFALNMPVDDPRVTGRLGHVNSDLCRVRQVCYCTALVKEMRRETAERGFCGAKLFLSVFYGWDNSFDVPCYGSSGADGYFLNNYSYPAVHGVVPQIPCSDWELINLPRLKIAVEKFCGQYPGAALMIEFGFHTLEYNHGEWPGQTAGLAFNRKAKTEAIRATLAYYRTVPEFVGFLYFGYNLFKEEGEPLAVMDWALRYPEEDIL